VDSAASATAPGTGGARFYDAERLNGLTDTFFSAQPECEMVREAKSLDRPGDKPDNASFEVLTKPHVFALFFAINPSPLAPLNRSFN
jgi:hypothetical protein